LYNLGQQGLGLEGRVRESQESSFLVEEVACLQHLKSIRSCKSK